MLPTQRVPGKGHGGGFPCRSPSSRAVLGILKATGQPPATSPRRIPGVRALRPLLLGLRLARSPPAASAASAPARPAGRRDCSGRPHALGDLSSQLRRAVWGRSDPAGAGRSAHAPGPGTARRDRRSGVGLGGPPGSPGGGRAGGAGSSAARSTLPAQGSPRFARAARGPLGPPVAAPAPRAPAPLLAPRAFQGRHLFATSSLLRQVCLGACEHSSARLSTRLQPAPPGQHASPPVKRGRRCPAARAAASPPRRY